MRSRGLYSIGQKRRVSGVLNNIFSAPKKKDQLDALLPQIAPACLYLYITRPDWGVSSASQAIGRRVIIPVAIPDIIRDKMDDCFTTLWNFGDQANVKVEDYVFPKIRAGLKAYLGMDPTDWWMKVLNSNQTRIGNIFQTVSDAFNIPGVKSLLGDLSLYAPVEQWAPSPDDWQGTSYQPFSFPPLNNAAAPAPGGYTPTPDPRITPPAKVQSNMGNTILLFGGIGAALMLLSGGRKH